ncbi:MAG: CHASE2 domain-containing protein [Candidatus Omnitrophica bacterium]|nr:CHASE2 domain-containing protein [Candidatus Omnitrophota bacterium]
MQRKKYLVFIILGVISFVFFFSPFTPHIPLKIDDCASVIFYYLNKGKIDPKEIVVVNIDDQTLRKIKSKWPFKRSLYAKALSILNQEKAKTVGFDIVFRGEGDLEGDKKFAAALKNFNGKAILAYFLDNQGNPLYPQEIFKQNSITGFINTPADPDGVIRKSAGYIKHKNGDDFSWAIKTAASFYGTKPQTSLDSKHLTGQTFFVNDKKILLNKAIVTSDNRIVASRGEFNINYLLKPKDFKNISFCKLISGDFPKKLFHNKVVLIGSTAKIIHDTHSTPLGKMPGVFIHANAIVNILNGKLLKSLPIFISVILLFLSLILTGYLLFSFSFLRGVFLSLGIILLLFWLNILLKFFNWQFSSGKVIVPILSYLVICNSYAYMNFLNSLFKIKNKTPLDPLTNIFNLRYFYQRFDLSLRSISFGEKYLVVVLLEGFEFFSKEADFAAIKNTWGEISSSLFRHSRFWARYSQEVIVGAGFKKDEGQMLKKRLDTFFSKEQVKVSVRIGLLKLWPTVNIQDGLPFLIEYLEKTSSGVVLFAKDIIPPQAHKKHTREDLFSSLYLDTEERNRELLSLIGKLKSEQGKAKEIYFQMISSLVVALESKDPYTEGHSQRVCKYSLMLADRMKLDEEEKKKIEEAALLHDLGKIGISDAILHKKGRLTDEEFSAIKQHGVIGAKILEPIKEFKSIIPYILHHHERYDGTGYPHGLGGEVIPLGARIIAVSDTFDAMTTGRSYKKAFPMEDAVREIKRVKCTQLDPHLAEEFIEVLKEMRLMPQGENNKDKG